THPDANVRLALITGLAAAAGHSGMVGGQMLDLTADNEPTDAGSVVEIAAMKTGALFRFAAEAGALVGGATDAGRHAMLGYGETLGLAFQLADDIADARNGTSTAVEGKASMVTTIGAAATRVRLADSIDQAVAALASFGSRGTVLTTLVRSLGAPQG